MLTHKEIITEQHAKNAVAVVSRHFSAQEMLVIETGKLRDLGDDPRLWAARKAYLRGKALLRHADRQSHSHMKWLLQKHGQPLMSAT
jgi:hypothetical protein